MVEVKAMARVAVPARVMVEGRAVARVAFAVPVVRTVAVLVDMRGAVGATETARVAAQTSKMGPYTCPL